MPIIDPDHLLDQADRLASPILSEPARQVDLRRAISSAYYAVFHTITTFVADQFIGESDRENPSYTLAYRSIDHGKIHRICKQIVDYNQRKDSDDKKADANLINAASDPAVWKFADAFVILHQKRHDADYDPLLSVTSTDATLAIATGREARRRFSDASEKAKLTLAALLVFPQRSSRQN